MMNMNGGTAERQEIEALLPWHAAGTLSRRDAERVERALAGDRELARHYDAVREELNETIHLNESLGAPSARAMEKLFAAIEADSARAPRRRSVDVAGRFAEFIASLSPRTLVWSAGAAVIAIMVQAAALTSVVVNDHRAPQNFQVASATADGATLEVALRFAPQASALEITNFLEAYKLALVEGPTRGLFTVRFTIPGITRDDALTAIRQMQNQTKVVEFVAAKN